MLKSRYARYLVAPANAVPVVKAQVLGQGGWVMEERTGLAVLAGLGPWTNAAHSELATLVRAATPGAALVSFREA